MIAKFISETECCLSLNVGEVNSDDMVLVWTEDAQDDLRDLSVMLKVDDVTQLIKLLEERRAQMLGD